MFSCGLKKEVSSSFNQKCIVDYLVDDINVDDYDALAIPGGFEKFEFYKEAYDEKFLNVIRNFKSKINWLHQFALLLYHLGKVEF